MIWIDIKTQKKITREQFLYDLKIVQLEDQYVSNEDCYLGYLKFLKLLILKQDVCFTSPDEMVPAHLAVDESSIKDLNWQDFLEILNNQVNEVQVELRTSGTTGKPKSITHSFGNLKRNVKVKRNNSNKTWLLCYHPYHMAGLQVFLQALLTDSLIINLDKSVMTEVENVIRDYQVSSLAFTPTFFKQFKYLFVNEYPMVESISFGGERASEELLSDAKLKFPRAKIRTIYASTEGGSLFSSETNEFIVDDAIKELIQIDKNNNELLLHEALVGKSDFLENGWHRTGDIVEMISNQKLKIVGRISDFVKIGGYKVNPHKVEDAIASSKFVLDVLIKSKENSVLGSILIAEVILHDRSDPKESKNDIIEKCREKLNNWEIPSMIKFVDSLNVGSTGKRIRN